MMNQTEFNNDNADAGILKPKYDSRVYGFEKQPVEWADPGEEAKEVVYLLTKKGRFVVACGKGYDPIANELVASQANRVARKLGANQMDSHTFDYDRMWHMATSYEVPGEGIGFTVLNSVSHSHSLHIIPTILGRGIAIPLKLKRATGKRGGTRKHTTNALKDGDVAEMVEGAVEDARFFKEAWDSVELQTAMADKNDIIVLKASNLPAKVLPKAITDEEDADVTFIRLRREFGGEIPVIALLGDIAAAIQSEVKTEVRRHELKAELAKLLVYARMMAKITA